MEPEKVAQAEQKRRAAIQLCVEIESSFKLYGYHILSHEQFTERIDELVGVYHFSTQQKVNEIEVHE